MTTWFGSADGSAGLIAWPPGYILGQSFPAPTSGNVTAGRGRMRVFSGSSDQAIMGIYAVSGGAPGALLGASDPATVPVGATTMINFTFPTPVAVVTGTSYFLVLQVSSGSTNLEIEYVAAGTLFYRSGAFGTPPDPFGSASTISGYRSYLEAGIADAGGGAVFVPQVTII